jgi:hypothetical protein
MSASCSLRVFQFGPPWDEAYFTCCQQARPQVLSFQFISARSVKFNCQFLEIKFKKFYHQIFPVSVNPPRPTIPPRNPPLIAPAPVPGGSPAVLSPPNNPIGKIIRFLSCPLEIKESNINYF